MKAPGVEDFAHLWKTEPTEQEREAFRIMGRRASRRARLLEQADRVLAGLLVLALLIAVSTAPRPATLAIGALIVIAIGWSRRRRQLLGQTSLIARAGDPQAFIRLASEDVRGALQRSTLGLGLLLPSVLLGALLRFSYGHDGDLAGFWNAVATSATKWPWGPMLLIWLLLFTLLLARGNFVLRRELRRLRGLERDYRREDERDSAPAD